MTNKIITKLLCSSRDLVRIFFFSPSSIQTTYICILYTYLGDSYQVHIRDQYRKVAGFDLLLHCLLLAKYSSTEFLGCSLKGALVRWLSALNLVRVWPEYDFSTFAKFLRVLWLRWVSQSVSKSVSRPREDV